MFYEKLAEKKQERANQGMSGGQMGAMAAGGALGGAGAGLGTTAAIMSGKIRPKFLDDDQERKGIIEKYRREKTLAQFTDASNKKNLPSPADFDPDSGDFLKELVERDEFLEKRLAEIDQRRKKALGQLDDKMTAKVRKAIAIPALIGTAAGAYGAKKLYDKYRGRKQNKE